jgi:hypothetical protein
MNSADALEICPRCGRQTLLTYTFPDRREQDCINPNCELTRTLRPEPVVKCSFLLGHLETMVVSQ